jgi:hypothetical protein
MKGKIFHWLISFKLLANHSVYFLVEIKPNLLQLGSNGSILFNIREDPSNPWNEEFILGPFVHWPTLHPLDVNVHDQDPIKIPEPIGRIHISMDPFVAGTYFNF